MAEFPFKLRITAAEKISQAFDRASRSVSGMNTALRNVNNRFAKLGDLTARVRERANHFGHNFVRVGSIITGASVGAAGASLYLLKQFTNTADGIAKAAPRVGLSTTAFQQLSFAATLAGAGQEELNVGLTRFARVVNDADRGLKTAQVAMKGLGIRTLRTASGALRPMNELLFEAIDGFSGMQDTVKRTALAQEAFGRGGAKLLNFFVTGSKEIREQMQLFDDLGGVIDENTLRASERFNDNFEIMEAILNTVKSTIAAGVLPMLEKLQTRTIGWIKQNKALIRTRLHEFVLGVADGLRSVAGAVSNVLAVFRGPNATMFGIDARALGKIIVIVGAITAALGPLAIAIGGVALAFAALTSPVGLFVLALGAVTAAGVYVWQRWDRIKAFFVELWDAPALSVKNFLAGPLAGVLTFAKLLRTVWGSVGETIAHVWNRLSGNAPTLSTDSALSSATPSARRLFNVQQVQQSLEVHKKSEARVSLDFKNVPRGLDIQTEQQGLDFMSTNLGFAGQF